MSLRARSYNRPLSFIVILCLKIYTYITRRPRVRVLVTNEHHEVLLIMGVISRGEWSLPGGGVGHDELLVDAAKRELHEETGIEVIDGVIAYVRTPTKSELPVSFTVPLFQANVLSETLPKKLHNPREIVAVGWFDVDHLPMPLSPIAKLAITELVHR